MKNFISIYLTPIFLFIIVSSFIYAERKHDETLRKANGVYDLQKYDRIGAEYYTTNYGIFGLNVAQSKGGLFWPRLSENQYIFASGFWFGAKKMKSDKSGFKKYVTLSYDPNNGRSWFVPGRIVDGDFVDMSKEKLYRIYFSDDFDEQSGIGDTTDGPNWPLWSYDYFGYPSWLMTSSNYVGEPLLRKSNNSYSGPLHHEFTNFCTYKDTDLNRYDDSSSRSKLGYPLRLQIDQRVFSNFQVHSFAPKSENIILQYVITNKSTDTLFECHFASIIENDLAIASNFPNGAGNDRLNFYYGSENQPDFAYAWTETDQGELGKGFGYMGVSFLEVPFVDFDGYIDTNYFGSHNTNRDLKGIKTFRNWPIAMDVSSDDSRYNFISSGIKDDDIGAGDNRMLLSTYPFNLRPNESVRFAVLIAFAKPSVYPEASGSTDDIGNLIDRISWIFDDYFDFGMDVSDEQVSYFSLTPNPANNYIEINNVILNEVKDPEIKVYNVLGIKYIDSRLRGNDILVSSEGNVRIDVSSLSPGVYFVRVGSKVSKFVKM